MNLPDDVAQENDRLWFEAHPSAKIRLRRAVKGEFSYVIPPGATAQNTSMSSMTMSVAKAASALRIERKAAKKIGFVEYALVVVLAPGMRTRKPIFGPPRDEVWCDSRTFVEIITTTCHQIDSNFGEILTRLYPYEMSCVAAELRRRLG